VKIGLIHTPFILLVALGVFLFVDTNSVAASAQASNDPLNVAALVMLTNQDRVASGAKALKEDHLLSAAAQRKADDMAKQGYFSHTSPNGNKPWSWLISSNYYYTHAGENLAEGFSDSQSIEQAWMRSPSHRSNIVDKTYTRVGVGIAHGSYQGRQTTFVVQFFATPYAPSKSRPASLATTRVK